MESLGEQFTAWESVGRGDFEVASHAVRLEPPFQAFPGYQTRQSSEDDGRRHTLLSRFFSKPAAQASNIDDKQPIALEPGNRDAPVEYRCHLPKDRGVDVSAFSSFLMSLEMLEEPLSFEFVASSDEIKLLFSCSLEDEELFLSTFQAYAPDVVLEKNADILLDTWDDPEATECGVFQLTYLHSFLYQLARSKQDLFVGLCGVLSELRSSEVSVFQVLFSKADRSWNHEINEACFDERGRPYPHLADELTKAARSKASEPLFATTIRLAARSPDYSRTIEIIKNLSSVLAPLGEIGGNQLTPMPLVGYDPGDREVDMILRQTARPGVLMTLPELLNVVHLPGKGVRSAKLKRGFRRTKEAPDLGKKDSVTLGVNSHRSSSREVLLPADTRVRHMHVIGAPGSGKSTFLEHLIRQDMANGNGFCVLDPHGELIDSVIEAIPDERREDVILFDPSDSDYSVAFNILTAHSDQERTLLASDLVSVFARLSTSWGDQMTVVLRNAIMAFLESEDGGTLTDLRRFLLDGKFRDRFLKSVRDPEIVFFWKEGFKTLTGGKSVGPIITRLETFLALKQVRYMVAQRQNSLDFRKIMDGGKIVLARLSQGIIGEENAYLLGSLLVSKFGQTAMARAATTARDRRDFFLYIDEFHSFITPSMAEIITGARKYRLGLILAHQHLGQLKRESEVASAVRSSIGTRVVFNVAQDAKEVAMDYDSFEAGDFQNLATGEALVRVGRSDHDFNIAVPKPVPVSLEEATESREAVVAHTRERYARPRAEIEAEILKSLQPKEEQQAAEPSTKERLTKEQQKEESAPQVDEKAPSEGADEKDKASPVAGRGGEAHQEIQRKIKSIAEAKGFRATLEKSVLKGKGSIDVVLERDDLRIAIETTVTTSVSHEAENVRKCIEAGYQSIVLVAAEKRLANLEGYIGSEVDVPEGVSLDFLTVEQVESWLPAPVEEEAPKEMDGDNSLSETRTNRGWKVKKKVIKLSEDEQRARDEAALKKIADALRKQ